jgi:Site-specific DNA methylase
MISLGSLFDGIGGFPLAAEKNGICPVWASKIERFPVEVTKYHFPQMRHMGDITKLKGENLPVVDIIAGGSPCQDLSVAGRREGLDGERSGLFLEQVRLVREMRRQEERRMGSGRRADQLVRPRYMVWENVPGAFSSGEPKGADFHTVLEEVCRIPEESVSVPRPPGGAWTPAGIIMGEGFSVAWRVLDAQFWGVPQRRRRIFLVADFGGHSAGKILFESESVWRHYQAVRKQREKTAGDSGKGAAPAGRAAGAIGLMDQGGAETIQPILFDNHGPDTRYTGPVQVAQTITSALGTGGNNTPLAVNGEPYCIVGNIINREDKNGGNGCGYQQGISYTLTATDQHCVACTGELTEPYQKVVGALCANDRKGINGQYVGQDKCIVEKNRLVRKLVPLECERLMGFPDYWTDIPGASDSARYKALGNSVAVPCVDFILCGIAYFLSTGEEEKDVYLSG